MTQEFYSNGKLLLSGEYAVLDGALALAIPTKFGQYLRVSTKAASIISWKSIDNEGNVWFEASYKLANLSEISSSDQHTSKALQNILRTARQLNTTFLKQSKGFNIETELTFPRDWGLGSSSTLINNIANWAKVDAQELLSKTFGGSGYDIACAQHSKPILYQIIEELPTVKEFDINYPFVSQLYFVFLNKKKNSRDAISAYRERSFNKAALLKEVTQLTKKIMACSKLERFELLIVEHEQILSKVLGLQPVKSKLFSDYSGEIKSLGGWGGDFILATGNSSTPEYFHNKGYPTVIPFEEMIA